MMQLTPHRFTPEQITANIAKLFNEEQKPQQYQVPDLTHLFAKEDSLKVEDEPLQIKVQSQDYLLQISNPVRYMTSVPILLGNIQTNGNAISISLYDRSEPSHTRYIIDGIQDIYIMGKTTEKNNNSIHAGRISKLPLHSNIKSFENQLSEDMNEFKSTLSEERRNQLCVAISNLNEKIEIEGLDNTLYFTTQLEKMF